MLDGSASIGARPQPIVPVDRPSSEGTIAHETTGRMSRGTAATDRAGRIGTGWKADAASAREAGAVGRRPVGANRLPHPERPAVADRRGRDCSIRGLAGAFTAR